jgi:hypothetical protein
MLVRLLFFAFSFTFVLASHGRAEAQGSAPIVIVEHSELEGAELVRETARWHEGFYFRAGLGFGIFVDRFAGDLGWIDATASGGSGAFELMVGGSLMDGLVLGGGVLVEHVVDPAIEVENVRVEDDVAVGTFVILGPFLDWYPSPAGGFHVQLLLGASRIDIGSDDGSVRDDHAPVGGGVALGAGYDFWIADEWSIGFLGRLSASTMTADDVSHEVFAASLLATVTYN